MGVTGANVREVPIKASRYSLLPAIKTETTSP